MFDLNQLLDVKKNRSSKRLLFMLVLMAVLSLSYGNAYADGCSGGSFRGAREYTFGQYPYHLATGDFNGDGKADVVVADFLGNSVRVAYGDGAGGFAGTVNVLVDARPVFVAAGDMNGDGKLDLVSSNPQSNTVSVLLNDGAGGFAATSYGTAAMTEGIALGDFNGDGKLDVVVANSAGSGLVLFYNNGPGTLGAANFISLASVATPHEVVAADFNNDGKTDVASVNQNSTVSVLLGLSGGGLSSATTITVPLTQDLKTMAVGDVTGDGKLDLVTGSYTASRVHVLAGNGAGGFTPTVSFPTINNLSDVELRDINGDGALDILALGSTTFTIPLVTVFYGNAQSTVSVSQDSALMGTTARSIALADLNGDGKPDLIGDYASAVGAGLTVSLNDGAGRIETAELLNELTGSSSYITSIITDLNLDGRPDLVLGANDSLSVRLGLSNASLGAPANYSAPGPVRIVTGDFNSDGRPDIATANSFGSSISVFLNNGSGGFGAAVSSSVGGTASDLVTGDFNSDGKLDLIVASKSLHAIRIFIGNGSGGFQFTGSINVNANPTAMVGGDFNNDGKLDVVTSNDCDGAGCVAKLLTFFAGDGMGSFALPLDATALPSDAANAPTGFAAADFNGDGRLDVIFTRATAEGNPAPQVALNTGGGNFGTLIPLATSDVQALDVGDVNGDGKPDVVIARSMYTTEIQVFLNLGAGNFGPLTRYASANSTNSITVGDINGDGKRDIVFTNYSGARRMLNKCALSRGKTTTDFDGDGITDLSVFRPSNGTWYIIQSSDNAFRAIPFGQSGDIPVAGDYDGDGRSDVAVFRPSNGFWYYLRSSDGQFAYQPFGANGDIPVQGDYDGDGKTNFAVWRPSTGTWYTSLDPATNYGAVVWGNPADIPAPEDYDGDGRTDIAVFRPGNAFWYLLQSAQGYREQQFGINGDTPVPADFDGDGKANFAVFRQSTGVWYTSLNPAINYGAIPLGQSGDVPVPGYYDGDGRADAAVFRQGDWYIFQSTNNQVRGVRFGASGDVPAPFAP